MSPDAPAQASSTSIRSGTWTPPVGQSEGKNGRSALAGRPELVEPGGLGATLALPAESSPLRERILVRVGDLAGVEESYYVVRSRWRVPEGS